MFYIGSERKCCLCDSSGFWLRNGQRDCREQKVSVILTKPENRCYGNTDFYLILIEKMNLLGKVDAWDNLIRIKSESIVQELMGMILKEFL